MKMYLAEYEIGTPGKQRRQGAIEMLVRLLTPAATGLEDRQAWGTSSAEKLLKTGKIEGARFALSRLISVNFALFRLAAAADDGEEIVQWRAGDSC